MVEKERMTTRLKELFERPELVVLVGGMNPMGAKMAEHLGYKAFYLSGAQMAAHVLGWPDAGTTSMQDMVEVARRVVAAVDIPVFADMDTGYGDALSVYRTVREYIRSGVAGAHVEDGEYPPTMGPRRQCISTEEMVGKLRAAMDAKAELDPDFVVVARCDLAWVPSSTVDDVIERCIIYKREANVDAICPNLPEWEDTKRAIELIPGPVIPLFSRGPEEYPTLEQLQEGGAAAAWYPAHTSMAALQANWDFLNDFKDRGTRAIGEFHERARESRWGKADFNFIFQMLGETQLREMERKYLPNHALDDS